MPEALSVGSCNGGISQNEWFSMGFHPDSGRSSSKPGGTPYGVVPSRVVNWAPGTKLALIEGVKCHANQHSIS